MPELDALFKKHRAEGLLVVALTDSSAEADCKRLAAQLSFPVAHADGALLKQFAIDGVPVSIFVSRDGKIASRLDGAGELAEFEGRLKNLL